MKVKKNFVLIFCLIAGIIVGSLLASFANDVTFLRFLSFSQTVGIPLSKPFVLDLIVAKFSFALEMTINLAQIICISVALLFSQTLAKKL